MTRPDVCPLAASLVGVDAVIEFGSRARGDAYCGDVDLLVVVSDNSARRFVADQLDEMAEQHRLPLAPNIYTWETLRGRLEAVPSFAAHLREEGHISSSDAANVEGLERLLWSIDVTDESLRREFDELRQRWHRLAQPSKLCGAYGTALGRLFALGRASAFLHLIREGEPNYEWKPAFVELSARHPEFADALETVSRIRPFYEALDGRRDANDLDWERAEEMYESSVRAVNQLTSAGSEV